MRKSLIVLGAAAAALVAAAAGPSSAHHSTNLYYDATKTVTLQGTFKEMKFMNPHTVMVFQVTDPSGANSEWQGETHGVGVLARFGWTPKMFKPGEKLELTGNPPRQGGKTAIHLLQVKEPNGKVWTVNNVNDN